MELIKRLLRIQNIANQTLKSNYNINSKTKYNIPSKSTLIYINIDKQKFSKQIEDVEKTT